MSLNIEVAGNETESTYISENQLNNSTPKAKRELALTSGSEIMSDSGVSMLDSQSKPPLSPISSINEYVRRHPLDDGTQQKSPISPNSLVHEYVHRHPLDADSKSGSSSENLNNRSPVYCAMQKLRHRIALQKAQIMKNLELNCDKNILDDGIAQLQELQRQYVKYEKEYQANGSTCPSDDEFNGNNDSYAQSVTRSLPSSIGGGFSKFLH